MEKCVNIRKNIQKKQEIVKSIFNSLSMCAIGEEQNNVGIWFIYPYDENKPEKQFNATFCVKCGNYIKEYSILHNSNIECKCRENIEYIKNKWKTNITLKVSNRHLIE
jgi:hypothetical protein